MVDGTSFAPLSPPSSPRMSAYSATPGDIEWQSQQGKPVETTPAPSDDGMALLHAEMSSLPLDTQKRPMLRTSKSYPYPLRPPSRSVPQPNSPLDPSVPSPAPQAERITISHLEEVDSTQPATVTFGGSAPASPVSRLTPPSPTGDKTGTSEEPHDEESTAPTSAENRTDGEEQRSQPSAADLRNQKRKMKRFRLTHNQTRFLMSEFARQAHPDAAHRERLAREIPGLSPRQVQVWFQNRRAKLKRLTSDDRERMMRSRALPDDFDMTQALHSPFGAAHGVGAQLGSPANYTPAFPEGSMIRPLTLDTMRRMPDNTHLSPTGITPAFSGFTFTPPQSATDTLSPVSATTDTGAFGYPSAPLDGSPRRTNPFVGSVTSAPAFTSHPQIPRLQADRIQRTRAESFTAPLRPAWPGAMDGSLSAAGDGIQSLDHADLSGDRGSGSVSPYGVGYSYSSIPGFQAGAQTRMRSFSSGVPRRIELSTHFTSSRSGTTPQTATFPSYRSSPLGTPTNYQVSQLSAPHHITTFQNSYLRQESGQTEPFPQVGTVLGELEAAAEENGNNAGDGVTLPPTY